MRFIPATLTVEQRPRPEKSPGVSLGPPEPLEPLGSGVGRTGLVRFVRLRLQRESLPGSRASDAGGRRVAGRATGDIGRRDVDGAVECERKGEI